MPQRTIIYGILNEGEVDESHPAINVDSNGNIGIQQTVDIASFVPPTPVTATIALNGTLSGAVDIGNMQNIGLIMPAVWTAAHITFQVSNALAGTYSELVDSTGTEVNIAVSAGVAYTLSAAASQLLAPWRFIKIQSGATGATVAQTAARNIVIVGK